MPQYELSEQQLIQMAQQEENNLNSKKALLNQITSILRETNEAIESLKEIQKKPKTAMMGLGVGVMVEVEIKGEGKCKRTFAENGYVEEKIEDTITWLGKRKEVINKQAMGIGREIAQSESKLNEIIGIVRQIETEKKKFAAERSKNISTK